jgi:pimeloyl-ACP methyl ester carboxylesterase
MKKIVLLHGWNYNNYTKFGCTDAWDDRKDFVQALTVEFEVYKINLPGFCGAQEPKDAWELDDFARFLDGHLNTHNIIPDYILGYSFGAAIALKWKKNFHKQTKIILISPAVIRAYREHTHSNISRLKKYIPKNVLKLITDLYLKYIRNTYYTNGTRFLKETYLNIVKVDLTNELDKIPPDELLMIFGSNDTATPPSLLKDKLKNTKLLKRIKVIGGGTHDIANSHIPTIMYHIKNFKNES